jgi:hypothetical protein
LISSGSSTISSGTATTTVEMNFGKILVDNEVYAIQFHSLNVASTYTTSIVLFSAGGFDSDFSVLMFPESNSTTYLDINTVRIRRSSTTAFTFSYAYLANLDSTPSYAADTIYRGRI